MDQGLSLDEDCSVSTMTSQSRSVGQAVDCSLVGDCLSRLLVTELVDHLCRRCPTVSLGRRRPEADCFVSVLTDRLRTSLVIVAHARLVPSAGVCCHSVFGSAEASRVVQSACRVGHSLLSRQSQALVTMSVLASRHSGLSSVRTKAHSGCFCYYSGQTTPLLVLEHW